MNFQPMKQRVICGDGKCLTFSAITRQNWRMKPTPGSSYSRLAEQTRSEQLSMLFQAMPVSLAVSILNAFILTYVLHDVIPITTLLVWLAVLLLVSMGRATLWWVYQQSPVSFSATLKLDNWFFLGTLMMGLSWGSSGIWLFAEQEPGYQAFLAFVLAGMTAGAMTSLGYRLRHFLAYSLSSLLPLFIHLWAHEGKLSAAMSLMGILFLVVLIVSARRFERQYVHNVELKLTSDQREHARRESEERYRSVFENSPLGVMHYDLDGLLLGCNQRFADLVGDTAERLAGLDVIGRLPNKSIVDAMRTSLQGKTTYYEGDYETILTQKKMNIRAYFNAIRDEQGQVIGGVVLAEDITEHEQMRGQLRSTQSTLSGILNTIPVRVFWKDHEGRYLGCNNLFAEDAGLISSDVIIGKNDRDLNWESAIRAYRELDQDVTNTGKAVMNNVEYREMQDGDIRWFEVSKVPLQDSEGKQIGMLGSYQDITERKLHDQKMRQAAQVAEDASKAKSEFLSSMSHELRTPLNAILGFAQVLEMGELDERQISHVQHILDGGEHLLELINQLLDLSRIEAGKLELAMDTVSVSAVVEDSLAMLMSQADDRGIQLSADLKDFDEVYVEADYTRLKQVLINLLSNAVKYNKDNGSVQISAEQHDPEHLRLIVSDSGPGIDASLFDKLFEPFVRVSADRAKVDGVGIGLPISKYLVNMMGGEINVESELGKGSSFWIDLKIAGDGSRLDDTHKDLKTYKEEDSSNYVIVYIEDNPSNLTLVEMVVESWTGLELRTADHPERGLEILREIRPDLILLDINLPGMDGYEVLTQIRQLSHLDGVPVLAVSSNAMDVDIHRGLKAGFDDYITKPIEVKAFNEMLASRVGHSQYELQ